jgi:hypothetical protein
VQVSAERGKLGSMRSFTAAVCAALAGAFALSGPGEQAGSGSSPKGRAGPRPEMHSSAGGGSPEVHSSAGGGSPDGGSADGGVSRNRRRPGPQVLGDPPGAMRVGAATELPADAGPPDVSARVDKLEKEMAELRTRAAALEVQLRQAQEQARAVRELHQQISDLRGQIAAEAERKAQAEQQQAARREQVESAVSALFSAEQVLARGDAAVGEALDDAERSLGGQAGRDVAAARLALQNRDLAQARYFLGIAIAHARQGQ